MSSTQYRHHYLGINMDNPEKHDPEREYDRSGFYTEEGKSFRIWALLAWLTGTVVFLAVVSALLNIILL